MPLIAGTGLQVYIALLSLAVGAAVSPLYEWTRPLKIKNKVLEVALDLFFMLASAGIFLLFTHFALKGRLSFYSVLCFYIGTAIGVFVLRKTQRFFTAILHRLKKLLFVQNDPECATNKPQTRTKKVKSKTKVPRLATKKLWKQ